MKRVPIAVAASILAAAALCPPAQALPQGLPQALRAAAPASPLLRVRYHHHRHRYYRRHDESNAAATDTDAGAIKPGQWEFGAQLEAAALPPPGSPAAPGTAFVGGGATKSTYAICVAADKAVPSAFVAGCRLDAAHRDGGHITWSMTCTNRQNAVRSEGVAQYRGDTMTATMVSHLPSAKTGGKTTDVAQYINGHYLGPCPSATTATPSGAAANAATPPASLPIKSTGAAATSPGVATTAAAATAAVPPASPPTKATGAAATAAVPPPASAASEGTASAAEPEPTTTAPSEASAAPPVEEHVVRHGRYHRHRRHYAYRRRRYGGGWYGNGSYSGFGPNPYSANGD